jgi:dCTP deaminase
MILCNVEILNGLEAGLFSISNLAAKDPTKPPFNTSAVDLRLGREVLIPSANDPIQLDLRKPKIAEYWQKNTQKISITPDQPYSLKPGKLVLANTLEIVDFPLTDSAICHAARVEGKSSLARCGIVIHCTAPTIHVGFSGPITLEIINFGVHDFLLFPEMFICQLIIEEVKGCPADAPNQFKGQRSPSGTA